LTSFFSLLNFFACLYTCRCSISWHNPYALVQDFACFNKPFGCVLLSRFFLNKKIIFEVKPPLPLSFIPFIT
jgi:hypothetical protein